MVGNPGAVVLSTPLPPPGTGQATPPYDPPPVGYMAYIAIAYSALT